LVCVTNVTSDSEVPMASSVIPFLGICVGPAGVSQERASIFRRL
jgi:hypothetical protein